MIFKSSGFHSVKPLNWLTLGFDNDFIIYKIVFYCNFIQFKHTYTDNIVKEKLELKRWKIMEEIEISFPTIWDDFDSSDKDRLEITEWEILEWQLCGYKHLRHKCINKSISHRLHTLHSSNYCKWLICLILIDNLKRSNWWIITDSLQMSCVWLKFTQIYFELLRNKVREFPPAGNSLFYPNLYIFLSFGCHLE